jgi:hypothetical protein
MKALLPQMTSPSFPKIHQPRVSAMRFSKCASERSLLTWQDHSSDPCHGGSFCLVSYHLSIAVYCPRNSLRNSPEFRNSQHGTHKERELMPMRMPLIPPESRHRTCSGLNLAGRIEWHYGGRMALLTDKLNAANIPRPRPQFQRPTCCSLRDTHRKE